MGRIQDIVTYSHLENRMSLKVYADLMSQPARAVVIFCRAAGIPHQHVPVRITAGDTKTEEYLAMNPLGKVPVLKDGEFVLTEPVATKKMDEEKVAAALKGMEATLGDIETVWLNGGKKKFLGGDSISVADIMAATELEQPSMAGYDVTKDRFGGAVPGVYPPPQESKL